MKLFLKVCMTLMSGWMDTYLSMRWWGVSWGDSKRKLSLSLSFKKKVNTTLDSVAERIHNEEARNRMDFSNMMDFQNEMDFLNLPTWKSDPASTPLSLEDAMDACDWTGKEERLGRWFSPRRLGGRPERMSENSPEFNHLWGGSAVKRS